MRAGHLTAEPAPRNRLGWWSLVRSDFFATSDSACAIGCGLSSTCEFCDTGRAGKACLESESRIGRLVAKEVRLDRRPHDREAPITLRSSGLQAPRAAACGSVRTRSTRLREHEPRRGCIWRQTSPRVSERITFSIVLCLRAAKMTRRRQCDILRHGAARVATTPTCSEAVISVMPPCHPHGARGSF